MDFRSHTSSLYVIWFGAGVRVKRVGVEPVNADGVILAVSVGATLLVGVVMIIGRGVKVEVDARAVVGVEVGVEVGVCNNRKILPGKLQLNREIHARR
jgi:hypothetical protein